MTLPDEKRVKMRAQTWDSIYSKMTSMTNESLVELNSWLDVQPEFRPCGSVRPPRKTICQCGAGHEGSHYAVIYWE